MTIPIVPLWIDGAEAFNSTTFPNIHAISGENTSSIVACDSILLQAAIKSNKDAFRAWADRPTWERRDILNRFGDLFLENKQEFFHLYSSETPVENMVMETDFTYALGHIREAAAICTQIKGDIPTTRDGSIAMVVREPYGVVFSMVPFNFAATLTLRTIVYPLACGNTVLCKANERLPQYILLLAQLLKKAGLPDGALNVVQFSPQTVAGLVAETINHADIRMVNFTGSTSVGSIIGGLCGKVGKPVLLELGGKAPAIVMASADLHIAANNILFSALAHSGQICMSTELALVHADVYDDFLVVMQKMIDEDLVKLDHFDMISTAGASKPKELWADALIKGARSLSQPSEITHDAKIPSVVMCDISPEMKIWNDESFGPNLSIIKVASGNEAVSISNSSGYGLSSSIFTNDLMEGMALAKRLETGAVHFNSSSVHDEPSLPHGGHKLSGHGRFNGSYAIQTFTQTKSLTFRPPQMIPLSVLQH